MKVVKLLLENGADIDLQDEEGYTALHAASQSGFTEIVSFLLEKQAVVNTSSSAAADPASINMLQTHVRNDIKKSCKP